MSHGLQLQARWNGTSAPPLCGSPPCAGSPALEVNHTFHFNMCPAIMLGPRCNHDLGILLRLALPQSREGDSDRTQSEHATSAMLEAMGDHEFYCSTYSSKEAPHVDGLVSTLADGLESKQRDITAARKKGEEISAHDEARQILHRLMSSTNRRMHKGFPEMLA